MDIMKEPGMEELFGLVKNIYDTEIDQKHVDDIKSKIQKQFKPLDEKDTKFKLFGGNPFTPEGSAVKPEE